MIDRQASIALLREELEQQRDRAEAAEAELRELRELRKLVDEWKAANLIDTYRCSDAEWDRYFEAVEALRHA